MKTSPCPNNPLLVSMSLLAAMCLSLLAQNSGVGSADFEPNLTDFGDTNELTAAIGEQQKHIARPDPGAMRLFVNAADAAARQAAAEQARQTALAARQSVREEIEQLSEGAIARFGPHQVTFPNRMPGVISLRTPDGLLLQSRVLGLAYLSDSGKSVLLAELKSSAGELVDGKTVIFRDVFDGASGDLVFEYTRTSFEQLVVIRRQLAPPEELGFSEEDGNVRLAVLTEWYDPPQPRKVARIVSLRDAYQALGIQREESLVDERLSFGAMRMVEGKSFALGEPDLSVPTGKTWETLLGPQGDPKQFLIEATPYRLLKPLLDALPVRTASISPRLPQSLQAALHGLKAPTEPGNRTGLMAKAQTAIDAELGVVLDYLIVNTPLLNVDFGWGGKSGPAAFGYPSYYPDYWNPYYYTGYEPGWLPDLYWSDWSQSSVGLTVSNAPGVGYNPFCLDPMYQYFIHPTNGGQITVTITNLPTDVYDLFVYATRASAAGAPKIELKRDGVSLWTKNTTYWGDDWYSTFWEESEQYVRFRNIAVTNQILTLVSYADASGYASLSGLQIVPSDAVPVYAPGISNLLNVNFGSSTDDKVGPAAVGIATNDYWNPYGYPSTFTVSVPNLKWSNQSTTGVGMVVWNSPGNWGSYTLFDPVLHSWKYAWNSGNTTVTLTNLPSGNCDVYIYTPQIQAGHNSMYELWSDGCVHHGTKASTLGGYNPGITYWEAGLQYVLFKDVTVSSNRPVVIHVKHAADGYQYLCGLQIGYKGPLDSDGDGLPDGWERKWFGNLLQSAGADLDSDGLSNLREYQLTLEPLRADSDADGIADGLDNEFPWFEEATPQGAYENYAGGDTWSWVTSWYDGDGWGGATVLPHAGDRMHVSAKVTGAMHQHQFLRAVSVTRPSTGDVLYAWVNLDSTYPPTEVMLQFNTLENNGVASWEHRAYWGANNLTGGGWGVDGTASRTNMGSLPTAGQWVRLEVPASAVGLEGRIVEGMAFTLYSGRAAWDSAGIFISDMDADGWLDSLELQIFYDLSQTPWSDRDGDGLPNYLDAEPWVFDTSPPAFEITSPNEGAVL